MWILSAMNRLYSVLGASVMGSEDHGQTSTSHAMTESLRCIATHMLTVSPSPDRRDLCNLVVEVFHTRQVVPYGSFI